MNKWIYRIMILAVGLCFVGGLLIGAGYAAGGARFLSQRDEGGRLRGDGKIYTEEAEVEAFDQIHVQLETSDLEILPSKDDKFRMGYRVYGKKEENPISWTSQGKVFTLKEKSPIMHVNFSIRDLFFFAGGREYKEISQKEGVTLYIPAGTVIKTTDINSVSGDIHLSASSLSDTKIVLGSGDLIMKECTYSGKNTMTISYGDCLVESPKPAAETISWNLQTDNGEIVIPQEMRQNTATLRQNDDELTGYTLNQDPGQPSISINSDVGDITVR